MTVDQLRLGTRLTSDLIYAGDTLAVTASAAVEVKTVAAKTKSTAVQTTSQSPAQASYKLQMKGRTFTMEATAYTASCEGCSGVTTKWDRFTCKSKFKSNFR